jgi:hypothetical protein
MRIPRVYSPQMMNIGDCIELEAGAARHLTSALRMIMAANILPS